MRVLITGGAGYIGSHVALQLAASGHDLIIVDNLSSGHSWAVLHGELVRGDLTDGPWLETVFARHRFDAVLHFAAHTLVPESVAQPLKYYRNNTMGTLTLLEACQRHGVERFIFSSSAAVYGMPQVQPVTEDTPCVPINPYGQSKRLSELMLHDVAAASGLRYVILRYFNVAGADPEGRLGQSTPSATHLIKVASESAVGKREGMTVFGDDYPTPDGTCVRDYIHVTDLAQAHAAALEYVATGGASETFNCGYGHGYSVREVIEAVQRISGVQFPVTTGPRRAGDPPALVADSGRIREILKWRAHHDDLDTIVRTALEWERKLKLKLKPAGGAAS